MDVEKSKQAYAFIQKEMQLHQKVCIHPQGYSMWPFLKEGRDSVIVKPLPVSSMHRGDIILYRRNDQILVLDRGSCQTKRDPWCGNDDPAKKTYFFKISSTLAAYKPSMAAFSSDKALYSSPIS